MSFVLLTFASWLFWVKINRFPFFFRGLFIRSFFSGAFRAARKFRFLFRAKGFFTSAHLLHKSQIHPHQNAPIALSVTSCPSRTHKARHPCQVSITRYTISFFQSLSSPRMVKHFLYSYPLTVIPSPKTEPINWFLRECSPIAGSKNWPMLWPENKSLTHDTHFSGSISPVT